VLQRLWQLIERLMLSWHGGKVFIEHSLSISHDSLHVIVGVELLLGFAMLQRRPITSLRPWLWVLAVILWNEAVDLWIEQWPQPAMQYGESAKDLLLTMLLPTVLLVAARLRPQLFSGGGRKRR
jgi:hypothetical protein